MINSNALRSSMAFRGQAAPAVSATQEYQVLFGALVAFLIGSGAVVLHALSVIGS